MRTTLALDDELVAKAQAFTGLDEKSSLVREALKAAIERKRSEGYRFRRRRAGSHAPQGGDRLRLNPCRFVVGSSICATATQARRALVDLIHTSFVSEIALTLRQHAVLL